MVNETKITIKKNPTLKLKLPEFIVDKPINKKGMPEPLQSTINTTNFSIFLAPPKMGKTSLLISFLNNKEIYKKQFHHIYVFMPENSMKSLKKNIFDVLPIENVYDDLNLFTIDDVYNKLNENTEKKQRSLLIFDDQTAFMKDVSKQVEHILNNRRHLRTTILMTLQTLKAVSLKAREVLDNLFVFKISKREFENIIDEFIEEDRKTALQLKKLYKKKGDWLLINVPSKRMWLKQDEIIIHNP